jgi:signal transduction histidine kinase/DNA-binding LacI/PurR family transcriptional regulator
MVTVKTIYYHWTEVLVLTYKNGGIRPTVGLLIHDIDVNVGLERYRGVSTGTQELDFNLLCIVQGVRTESDNKNIFYDIAATQIDGLVCGVSVGTSLMNHEELERFWNKFEVPKVNMIDRFANISSVITGDFEGVREALIHLIAVHGFRKIFFVRGPENHIGGKVRYRAYLEVMEEYRLYDPDLVSPPLTWDPAEQQVTMEQVFGAKTPGTDFEAVMFSNDLRAIDFIEKFREAGIRVPEDVAVIGFNDSHQAKNNNPPLTSVAIPLFEQGKIAVEMLADLMQDIQTPNHVIVPSQLSVRRSCGCLDPDILDIFRHNLEFADDGQPDWLQDKAMVCAEIKKGLHVRGEQIELWLDKMVGAFRADLTGNSQGQFLNVLCEGLQRYASLGWDTFDCHKALSIFRAMISLRLNEKDYGKRDKLIQQARELVGRVALRFKEDQISQKNDRARAVNRLQTELSCAFEQSEMIRILVASLPKLGFESCYFVLYEDPQPYIHPMPLPKYSRLIMGYNRDGRIDIAPEGIRFSSYQILPQELLPADRRYNFVVTPMYFGQNQFGYIIFEMDSIAQPFYKVICNQLKSSLWGMYMFQKQKMIETSLARSNAELERFAYVASHDLQEPLRKVLAFGDRLKKCNADRLTEQGRDYLERIQSAAYRMHHLINDLLTYSRVTSKPQPFSRIDLRQVLEEVLSDLEVKVAQTGAMIHLGKLPALDADPVQVHQLFLNLMSNALKFHRAGVPPELKIYGEVAGENVAEIVVADNGIGIESSQYERIFGVFEKLHGRDEYEGSGIGLAICKKIVEHHGGNIRINSIVGEGTRFFIRLPLEHNK